MSLKTQFIKCMLCVVFYIAVCSVLLKIRYSSYSTHQDVVVVIKTNQITGKWSTVSRTITKPISLEIKLLKRDEMRGETINLEESAAILQQISNVCAKYNLRTSLTRKHFLYNSNHKSMYCWIRKVASTSFTKLFAEMKHRPPTENYYKEVNVLAPKSLDELQTVLNNTEVFKFLIVRHPFQRLLSAYRDRIEDNTKYTAQAWIYVKKIFRITRPGLFYSNTTTGTFHQNIFTPDKRLRIVPTFKEFSIWLLRNAEDDVHWDQYYTHCAVCNVRYNYVLKLDDYSYGQINYIFSKLGLDKNKVYLPRLEETRGGQTDFDTTCRYFGNLTQDIVLKLYERYKIDFEMYDYDFNRYIDCIDKKV